MPLVASHFRWKLKGDLYNGEFFKAFGEQKQATTNTTLHDKYGTREISRNKLKIFVWNFTGNFIQDPKL